MKDKFLIFIQKLLQRTQARKEALANKRQGNENPNMKSDSNNPTREPLSAVNDNTRLVEDLDDVSIFISLIPFHKLFNEATGSMRICTVMLGLQDFC